ncbi:MAG: AAA family ATPase [Acidimicrobiales bacterium]
MPKVQLLELQARGLALIDDAALEFAPGLNVVTGETGAGKTLLVGALTLCLGGESPGGEVGDDLRVATLWRDGGGAERLLARELTATGRLRSVLDGQVTSADGLRRVAESLVDIYGQRSSLRLRSPAAVLALVDGFGDVDTSELDEVRARQRDLGRRRAALGGDREERTRARALAEFELAELRAAALTTPDELDGALAALERWQGRAARRSALLEALERLDGDREVTALGEIARIAALVEGAGESAQLSTQLRGALEMARDAGHELRALLDAEDLDEAQVVELEERVGILSRVARRYGGSLAAALETREERAADLERWRDAEDELARLDAELAAAAQAEQDASARVRARRESAGARFGAAVTAQLARVALAGGAVRVEVGGVDGSAVRLLVRTNPGRAEGPVEDVASGGELSRLLLAVALVSGVEDAVGVFDEIDAGLGGAVAEQIGACLAEVARARQVLVVTHLASVAARAQRHFVVHKETRDGRAVTTVRAVAGEERVEEIARMLAGAGARSESRALARRLLSGA